MIVSNAYVPGTDVSANDAAYMPLPSSLSVMTATSFGVMRWSSDCPLNEAILASSGVRMSPAGVVVLPPGT
jgi:hypothetical protein